MNTLIAILVALIVAGLLIWGAGKILAVLKFPEPFNTIIYVIVVCIAVLLFFQISGLYNFAKIGSRSHRDQLFRVRGEPALVSVADWTFPTFPRPVQPGGSHLHRTWNGLTHEQESKAYAELVGGRAISDLQLAHWPDHSQGDLQ